MKLADGRLEASLQLTNAMLAQGTSDRGGFSREQLEALGVGWPLVSGWEKTLLDCDIAEAAYAEFLRLGKRTSAEESTFACQRKLAASDRNGRFGRANSALLHIYALALEEGFFYVGMTDSVERRYGQHCAGIGANWTALHRPVQIVQTVCTGTTDRERAAKLEDEVTLELMLQHGADKVRGGCYCDSSQ